MSGRNMSGRGPGCQLYYSLILLRSYLRTIWPYSIASVPLHQSGQVGFFQV